MIMVPAGAEGGMIRREVLCELVLEAWEFWLEPDAWLLPPLVAAGGGVVTGADIVLDGG